MSVTVVFVEGKYRLIENGSKELALSKNGKPMDGGGHDSFEPANRQAIRINGSKKRVPDS